MGTAITPRRKDSRVMRKGDIAITASRWDVPLDQLSTTCQSHKACAPYSCLHYSCVSSLFAKRMDGVIAGTRGLDWP